MSAIPDDIMCIAQQVWVDALKEGTPDAALKIGAAMLAERDTAKAMCEEMAKALERLSSPEAFTVSRVATKEETARMFYAQAAFDAYRKAQEAGP